jgi:hypothetical protein
MPQPKTKGHLRKLNATLSQVRKFARGSTNNIANEVREYVLPFKRETASFSSAQKAGLVFLWAEDIKGFMLRII